MSLFGILNTGRNGMTAASFGTATASHNASNVATPGFSRRVAHIEPIGSHGFGGARASGADRITDPYLERRLLGAHSSAGEASARATSLSALDDIFSEAPGNLGPAFDDFQTALSDLAVNPGDTAARQLFLSRAGDLSRAFNNAAAGVGTAIEDTNARITSEVEQLNAKLHEIAKLGAEIARAETGGQDAGDLHDLRDQHIREIAQSVPITVVSDENGAISVLLSGSQALVSSDNSVHELSTAQDPATGTLEIYRQSGAGSTRVSGLITGGRIGGYIAARDGTLSETMAQLDALASDVVSAYNGAHSAGVGLDGGSGRNLFTPVSGADAARQMSLSADVAGQPDHVAAAIDASSLPGDNRGALVLQDLAATAFADGGTKTAGDALGSIVASVGVAVQSARAHESQTGSMVSQVEAVRESISGVSSDEEMISLMKFQRSYQASLRVIEVADQMLSDLLNMGR
ncbi:MAG: flagellar hook-associated protein FlgK [Myxococcales bacterium]|nr:flagellar hook-associated protein FlgK [Myxococcales bacterium]